MPHFHHFSICNHNQSISHLVIFHQNTKAIALLCGHKCLIFITVNLQSKSINFKFGHVSPKYQGYSLTSWPKMPHCHQFSVCNQTQSISHLFIRHQNTKAIALRFGHKCLIFITFQSAIKINQFHIWSFLTKIPRLQPYFLAKHASFSSLFTLQSKSINVKFGHLSPKYQGYSLTFWPQMPYFHHFSICGQNQSMSNLVTFHQNTKAIACVLATNASFSSLFNLQSQSINVTFGHFSPKYQGYSLTFWPQMPHFHHFQSAIKINQFQIWSYVTKIPRLQPYIFAKNASLPSLFCLQSNSINFTFVHLSPKYQGYNLTFWPQIPHFHHFSICNQNHSISHVVMSNQNTKAIALLFAQTCLIFISFHSVIKINQCQIWSFVTKIPRLQPYFSATNALFSSLFNLRSKSINVIFGNFSPKYQGYSLCVGHKCLIFITFQSAIKLNQCHICSLFTKIPRLQPYCLATNASFSSLFNLQSKSFNFRFGHLSPKYQGHSLTFLPKMPHCHHFSVCNQTQSILHLFICHQNTKAITLLFGHKYLMFITFQSAIKITQFHMWSCLTKIPRLQPYCLPKHASFSSLFTL